MSSLTLGTPAPGQAVGRRAPAEGAVTGPVPDRSRRQGVAETSRVVASMIALYAFLLVLPLLVLAPASAQSSSGTERAQQTAELAAQPRPRITVRPRRTEPGPNSLRYCESWLATENRPSGTVITPQMRCWWQ